MYERGERHVTSAPGKREKPQKAAFNNLPKINNLVGGKSPTHAVERENRHANKDLSPARVKKQPKGPMHAADSKLLL